MSHVRQVLQLALLLAVLPVLFLAPSLVPGRRLLPILPSAFEPLASEDPAGAAAARETQNYLASERVFPCLTDDSAIRNAWHAGELPLWDANAGLGQPLAANARHGAWYPLNVLSWIFSPDSAAGFEALIALFLAGLGLHLFLAARGLPGYACLFGAWAFQAGGFALENLQLPMRVDAALWLPFALYGVERLVARQRFGGLVVASAIALSFLAGFPPIAVFTGAATVCHVAWRSAEAKCWPLLAAGLAWIATGILAAAIAWMPMLEAKGQSFDSRLDARAVAARALPVASLGTLFVPTLFGAPAEDWTAAHDPAAWWLARASETVAAQQADALEWSLFAGVAVFVLAVVGLVSRPREAAFSSVLLALAIGFSLGAPVVSWLYHVPGFDQGTPSSALGVASVCWPIMAALGLQALVERRRRATPTACVVAVTLALVGGFVALTFDADAAAHALPRTLAERHGVALDVVATVVPPPHVRSGFERVGLGLGLLALVSLGVLGAVLLSSFVTRRSQRARVERADAGSGRAGALEPHPMTGHGPLAACLPWFALVAFEGSSVARAHLSPRTLGDRPVFPASEAIDAIRDAAGDGRVVRYDSGRDGLGDSATLARPNLLAAYGIADLTPTSTFTPVGLVEMIASVQGVAPDTSILAPRPSGASASKWLGARVLDLLRVTCVLSRTPLRDPRLRLVFERPGFCVYARSGALARARVVPSGAIVAASRDTALQLLTDELHDPRRAVVIAAEDLPPESERPRESAAPFVPGVLEVATLASNRVAVQVKASSGGWLVVHDQIYPGWKATVNGADARIVRADHVYRAVAIPPGNSMVELVYAPHSLRFGALMSLVAAAAALSISVRRARALPE